MNDIHHSAVRALGELGYRWDGAGAWVGSGSLKPVAVDTPELIGARLKLQEACFHWDGLRWSVGDAQRAGWFRSFNAAARTLRDQGYVWSDASSKWLSVADRREGSGVHTPPRPMPAPADQAPASKSYETAIALMEGHMYGQHMVYFSVRNVTPEPSETRLFDAGFRAGWLARESS